MTPEPACADLIDNNHRSPEWRDASRMDLDTREPCSLCFPDAETVADIDRPLFELLVARSSGTTIHRIADGHDPSTACLASTTDKSLHHRLADPDFGPEDIGLGGDA